MIIHAELPIWTDTGMFFLSSVTNNQGSKFLEFHRIEFEVLIIFSGPTIKPDLKKLIIVVFVDDEADPPISLVILSINKVVFLINFPKLFGIW